VRNFVMLLLDKGRIATLPDIARAHRTLVDEQAGRVRATVTSARPLDPVLETRLKAALERQSGKTVILEKREDPAIVGGLVTQLGDIVYDGSVRTQLQQLREELLSE
jgi:F-type H+-transporting ATPase subunit delta